MGKIKVLDLHTANKIAAGEVVERPAAAVKELIENALDAAATHIDIQITGGGLEMIRVVDNGSGMAPEDAVLALERHATSKIMTAEDISTVLPMGFGGEALPSMAAVSRFRLVTRRQEDFLGTEIVIEGGKLVKQQEAGSPAGTEVKVEDLFFNTPARRKFMKSAGAETARITDTVQRLALARPDVAFHFSVDEKTKLVTSGNGQLEDAAGQVLGLQNLRQMLPLAWEGSLVTLHGFVSKPALCRANRNLQYIFVNKRPIRSPLISDAVQTAYHTLLPRNRFPAVIIYLEINPEDVDVNVHPTKREVRFSRERDLYRQILAGVKSALSNASLIKEIQDNWRPAQKETAANLSLHDYGLPPQPAPAFKPTTVIFDRTPQTYPGDPAIQPAAKPTPVPATSPETSHQANASRHFPALHVLGQYLRTYILAQSEEDDLYLIDQHAAHERVLYDLLKKDLSTGELPVQEIIPQTYELDAQSAAVLEESLKLFTDLGLNFETFGNNTFILRSVPMFYKTPLKQEELQDLLEQAKTEKKINLFEKTMQMMSCKAAIKANQTLELPEMTALLRNLAQTTQPYTCPHGRPTVMVLNKETIAKNFGRI